MIKPFLSGDEFLADVAAQKPASKNCHIWWLGQSGFLVQDLWRHRTLLLDPYLSDSLTFKYAATDRPHVRMTERVIEPERLTFIDVVACTHNHTDHFDPDTLRPLLAANSNLALVVPEANRRISADRLGVPPERLIGIEEDVETEAFNITAVPAAHETIERDEQGRLRFVGYLFYTTTQTIYHAGDTVLYDGMAESIVSRSYCDIDVALLPINGRDPTRGVPGNMNGREAASLARQIGARVAIPCHYEMFEFNTASPNEFVAECERLGQDYCVLRNGERWSGM